MTGPPLKACVLFLAFWAGWLLWTYSDEIRRRYERWRHPAPLGGGRRLAAELKAEIDARERASAMRAYRVMEAELESAGRRGLPVRALRQRLAEVLKSIERGEYVAGRAEIDMIRMSVPRNEPDVRVAERESLEEMFPGITKGLAP